MILMTSKMFVLREVASAGLIVGYFLGMGVGIANVYGDKPKNSAAMEGVIGRGGVLGGASCVFVAKAVSRQMAAMPVRVMPPPSLGSSSAGCIGCLCGALMGYVASRFTYDTFTQVRNGMERNKE